ncbi:MAG: endonuclease domain-containing protein [Bacteroidetes bacterium]|nr:MAG: endonuclease domain-containing protein [Bacteroidota bacterium]
MMKRGMFYKADPLIFAKAKELRNKTTAEENVFWLRLKETFAGYKFRRQHPISNYIVDFYCHKLKLVIEIDGPIHEQGDVKENDTRRQNDLENLNLTILRFTNAQIKLEIEKVLTIISELINSQEPGKPHV